MRLRSPGSDDVVLDVGDDHAELFRASGDEGTAEIELDPAARLLLLWGRRPSPPHRARTRLSPTGLRRLQTILGGY